MDIKNIIKKTKRPESKNLSIRMPEKLAKDLTEFCQKNKINRNSLMNQIIIWFMNETKNKKKGE